MEERHPKNSAITAGLLTALILWGQNNAATKYLLDSWPPITVGFTRFLAAGLILLAVLHWTNWLGRSEPVTPELNRRLWLQASLPLGVYIICYTMAMSFTSPANVALHLGTAPVWALLFEGRPRLSWKSAQSYGAALLALSGVIVLFWPTLRSGSSRVIGELFGVGSSVMWTVYGRQCGKLSKQLLPAEISACTFWRAGLLLMPLAIFELLTRAVPMRADLVAIQVYCILASGVVAFILWNNALRHWPTSRVYLFNNLIPLSTMIWASVLLNDKISPTFWTAMLCIVGGVLLGQTNWQKVFARWLPST